MLRISLASSLSTDITEVLKLLKQFDYVEKDPTRQRIYRLTEKGMEHAKFVCTSKPLFEKEVYDEIRDMVKEHNSESRYEAMEKEDEAIGKREKTDSYYERYGHEKIGGTRTAWLISQYTGVPEEEIIEAAKELGYLTEDGGFLFPNEIGALYGIKEERTLFFSKDAQKKILDYLGMKN